MRTAESEIRSGISLYSSPTGDATPCLTATIPSNRLHKRRNWQRIPPVKNSPRCSQSFVKAVDAKQTPAAMAPTIPAIDMEFGLSPNSINLSVILAAHRVSRLAIGRRSVGAYSEEFPSIVTGGSNLKFSRVCPRGTDRALNGAKILSSPFHNIACESLRVDCGPGSEDDFFNLSAH